VQAEGFSVSPASEVPTYAGSPDLRKSRRKPGVPTSSRSAFLTTPVGCPFPFYPARSLILSFTPSPSFTAAISPLSPPPSLLAPPPSHHRPRSSPLCPAGPPAGSPAPTPLHHPVPLCFLGSAVDLKLVWRRFPWWRCLRLWIGSSPAISFFCVSSVLDQRYYRGVEP